MTIEAIVQIVDRAEAWAMEHEPELQELDRVERRQRLAEATFRRLRAQERQRGLDDA